MAKYCIGIDIGTSAIKTVLVDENLTTAAFARKELRSVFPHPGWVEQDGEEIYKLLTESVTDVLNAAGLTAKDIAGIGLDHQGESCLVWDRKTGKPIYPAITWQDRRTSIEAKSIKDSVGDKVFKTTGQPADSYYSAFKIRWILQHFPEVNTGNLLAGTLNTYIIWKLSEGKRFYTDPSSACCTLLYDPREKDWSRYLMDLFGIPRAILPEIGPMIGFEPVDTLLGIPILSSSPDCQAGLYSLGTLLKNNFATTYGTGNFIHFPTGSEFVLSEHGSTSTVLFASPEETRFQINGICYTAGSAVKWLINGLKILENEKMSSEIALSVEDTKGITFVPALTGIASPYWDENARGAFLGLTAGAGPEHLIRAVLESIAYQVASVTHTMIKETGFCPGALIALGGITANEFLMQFQADMLGLPVVIPKESEPCFGAAGMAFSALNRHYSLDESPFRPEVNRRYDPRMDASERERLLSKWQNSVKRCLTDAVR